MVLASVVHERLELETDQRHGVHDGNPQPSAADGAALRPREHLPGPGAPGEDEAPGNAEDQGDRGQEGVADARAGWHLVPFSHG